MAQEQDRSCALSFVTEERCPEEYREKRQAGTYPDPSHLGSGDPATVTMFVITTQSLPVKFQLLLLVLVGQRDPLTQHFGAAISARYTFLLDSSKLGPQLHLPRVMLNNCATGLLAHW